MLIGVDVGSMLYLHLETVEDIFEGIEEAVTKIRESDKDRLVTILVDSLALELLVLSCLVTLIKMVEVLLRNHIISKYEKDYSNDW